MGLFSKKKRSNKGSNSSGSPTSNTLLQQQQKGENSPTNKNEHAMINTPTSSSHNSQEVSKSPSPRRKLFFRRGESARTKVRRGISTTTGGNRDNNNNSNSNKTRFSPTRRSKNKLKHQRLESPRPEGREEGKSIDDDECVGGEIESSHLLSTLNVNFATNNSNEKGVGGGNESKCGDVYEGPTFSIEILTSESQDAFLKQIKEELKMKKECGVRAATEGRSQEVIIDSGCNTDNIHQSKDGGGGCGGDNRPSIGAARGNEDKDMDVEETGKEGTTFAPVTSTRNIPLNDRDNSDGNQQRNTITTPMNNEERASPAGGADTSSSVLADENGGGDNKGKEDEEPSIENKDKAEADDQQLKDEKSHNDDHDGHTRDDDAELDYTSYDGATEYISAHNNRSHNDMSMVTSDTSVTTASLLTDGCGGTKKSPAQRFFQVLQCNEEVTADLVEEMFMSSTQRNEPVMRAIDTFYESMCHPIMGSKVGGVRGVSGVEGWCNGIAAGFKTCNGQNSNKTPPYYDEQFTLDFLHTMMTDGISVVYLQPPNSGGGVGNGVGSTSDSTNHLNNDVNNSNCNSNYATTVTSCGGVTGAAGDWSGRAVTMVIEPGTTGSEYNIQPKLEWTTKLASAAAGGTGGFFDGVAKTSRISLMNIMAIHSSIDAALEEGKNEDYYYDDIVADQNSVCFFTITSTKGDIYVFEANSISARDRIVNGLRNVIARMSLFLVSGDVKGSAELYCDDALPTAPGELPTLSKQPDRAIMNRLAHALLD